MGASVGGARFYCGETMEKQDINLIKQIHAVKISWDQEKIDQALSLKVGGYIEYSAKKHSGRWMVTEKGMVYANR